MVLGEPSDGGAGAGPSGPVRLGGGVLGVDACRAGWVGAFLGPEGRGAATVVVAPTVALLLQLGGAVPVVGVDIPIGLPDSGRREADVRTRRFLGGVKSSSVFTTPTRAALQEADYAVANACNRERAGMGLSRQAHALRESILEVDAWLRGGTGCRVVEVHPEASFAMMTGAALPTRKRTPEGQRERRAALAGHGIRAPSAAPRGAGLDDVLDACAAAWSAHRVRTGLARTFPDEPEVFADGIPAAIHV
ncbi:DUF429 domain-containing protein [uncultured Serinicoccus sp.]|uniref:DUF429 domain-containing protein n=1 Tax=uncultured Serinicoccus sp. TaxID=735514 RepID=UPI00261016A4|nr:DUF429 domain-containing protein [uncultured Serinicoccus sp.]